MISLNKIGGQSDTASASFNVSKTADIANLPTDGVPNCSTCIDWSTWQKCFTKNWSEKI